ncbi:MAG: UDP-N-acetylmuramoyl-L-alanyl-D-glutamate--2,6-diaminopimelate ligase [Candidatus Omnitrophota bacterium]
MKKRKHGGDPLKCLKEEIVNGRVGNIRVNSKIVSDEDVFIALEGTRQDGHDFLREAVKKGARYCIVSDKKRVSRCRRIGRSVILGVRDTRQALSELAYELYERPADKLNVTGITGTNGKTTVAFLIEKIFRDAGKRTGLIGTIHYKIGRKKIRADRTTPDALSLNGYLDRMFRSGVTHAVMEVSSHALDQKRAAHVFFDTAVFTNITPEHLDYHKNMDAYFRAKMKIFSNLKRGGKIALNIDDPRLRAVRSKLPETVVTFGAKRRADIYARDISCTADGSCFTVVTPVGTYPVGTALLGAYNVSNILAAFSAAYGQGLKPEDIACSIEGFRYPPGRLEGIDCGQPFRVYVDYAHTDDALANVLIALRPLTKKRIITVFGCGGDRDRSKRPRMGAVSSELSDFTIVTSDNPRTEKQEDIAGEIEEGIINGGGKYCVILDRKDAITCAFRMARRGDIVLIAGKGHETEQIIGQTRLKFDDRKVARDVLGKRGYSCS